TVLGPPVILEHSGNLTVNEGGFASFSVKVTGSPVLNYQWFRNGEVLLRETHPDIFISETTNSVAGTYSVLVWNLEGQVSSEGMILTVRTQPIITAQPL